MWCRNLLALALLCVALVFGGEAKANCTAPCTKSQITTDINTNWPDNTTGAITPALLRSTVLDLVNSYFDLLGTATNDNAAAGNAGEYVESVISSGSAVSLLTSTPKDVTTISLTAGDWDVSTSCSFVTAASTSVTVLVCSASTTLNTVDTTNGRQTASFFTAVAPGAGTGFAVATVPLRFSLASTTTIHMVVAAGFTVSTMSAYGIIRARRIR
jgi:hypothetical protein